MKVIGGYFKDDEQFFVFHDGTPMTLYHARSGLKILLGRLNLDSSIYGMHSF